MEGRAEAYNRDRAELFQAEREGRLLVVAPKSTLGVSRTERDTEKLRLLWAEGYPLPGDGVSNPAVQIGLTMDLKDGKEQRHSAAGLEDHRLLVPPRNGQVIRSAGVQVGDHSLHFPARCGRGRSL